MIEPSIAQGASISSTSWVITGSVWLADQRDGCHHANTIVVYSLPSRLVVFNLPAILSNNYLPTGGGSSRLHLCLPPSFPSSLQQLQYRCFVIWNWNIITRHIELFELTSIFRIGRKRRSVRRYCCDRIWRHGLEIRTHWRWRRRGFRIYHILMIKDIIYNSAHPQVECLWNTGNDEPRLAVHHHNGVIILFD